MDWLVKCGPCGNSCLRQSLCVSIAYFVSKELRILKLDYYEYEIESML